MIKVFLVEDEFIIREGIKNDIDWEANGYQFCGEAGDGELAYPLIQKEKPDIVLTDIKMPFMDGLALSRLIKDTMPETEIMILTGHEEFGYAKEGISLGVAEYLLKPISAEELLRSLNGVRDKILEKRREKEIRERYQKEMAAEGLQGRRDFFQHLVSGSRTVAELYEEARRLQIDLSAIWYDVVLFSVKSDQKAPEEYSNPVLVAEQKIKDLIKPEKVIFFDRYLDEYAMLFKDETKEDLLAYQKQLLEGIRERMKECKGIQYFAGVGGPVNRLMELSTSYENAGRIFANRYFIDGNHILYHLPEVEVRQEEGFNLRTVDPKEFQRSRIEKFLRVGEPEDTVYFVEEFLHNLGADAMDSKMFRQYILMDAYFCVVEFVQELQQDRGQIETFDINSEIMQSRKEMERYLVRIMDQALACRRKASGDRYSAVVQQVVDYIAANYGDEELSLNRVASHVNFSPNHLSMIFSQQTGSTFIKYLTDYRMEKAKELLRCTNKKTSIIGSEVGYKDSHYFSFLFKKTQGMTPTVYRNGGTEK